MMATHYDTTGAEKGSIELSADVFGVEPHETVLHRASSLTLPIAGRVPRP